MKGGQMKAMWMTGLALAAVAAAPAAMMMFGGAPAAAATPTGMDAVAVPVVIRVVEPAPTTGTDPVVRRATTASAAPAPVAKGQRSGADGDSGSKCIVKSWQPTVLKSYSYRPITTQQSKLICTDNVGTSEIIIEQNDQIVVAGTVVNNQTNVTLHSLTISPNDEQWEDAFCSGIARQHGNGGSFGVVAQDCAPLSNFGGHGYGKKGRGRGW